MQKNQPGLPGMRKPSGTHANPFKAQQDQSMEGRDEKQWKRQLIIQTVTKIRKRAADFLGRTQA